MRKYILLAILLCLIPFVAYAISPIFGSGGVSISAGPTLLIGVTTPSGGWRAGPAGRTYLYRFQCTTSGTVASIIMTFHWVDPGDEAQGVMYADSGGDATGNPLDIGDSIVLTNNVLNTLTGLSVPVTSGTYYWFGFYSAQDPGWEKTAEATEYIEYHNGTPPSPWSRDGGLDESGLEMYGYGVPS